MTLFSEIVQFNGIDDSWRLEKWKKSPSIDSTNFICKMGFVCQSAIHAIIPYVEVTHIGGEAQGSNSKSKPLVNHHSIKLFVLWVDEVGFGIVKEVCSLPLIQCANTCREMDLYLGTASFYQSKISKSEMLAYQRSVRTLEHVQKNV